MDHRRQLVLLTLLQCSALGVLLQPQGSAAAVRNPRLDSDLLPGTCCKPVNDDLYCGTARQGLPPIAFCDDAAPPAPCGRPRLLAGWLGTDYTSVGLVKPEEAHRNSRMKVSIASTPAAAVVVRAHMHILLACQHPYLHMC